MPVPYGYNCQKTPVKAFGAKVLLIPLAGNYKRCCHIQNFGRNAREIKKVYLHRF